MNIARKKKAIKLYENWAKKSLTHVEIMDKLNSDLDCDFTKKELEEIEADVTDSGTRVMPQAAKPSKHAAKQDIILTGGNRIYEEWLAEVKWHRDPNDEKKLTHATVTKMKMIRPRVIITKETADNLNHSHMAPSCNRPILYILPDHDAPENY